MKQLKLKNFNPDKEDSLFFYVEPEPVVEEGESVAYAWVSKNPSYAKYWSNNWRKNHGYPLRRGGVNRLTVYVKPVVVSKEATKRIEATRLRIQEIYGLGTFGGEE